MVSERVQREIDRLLVRLSAARDDSEWGLVRELSRGVLALDPSNGDARAMLEAADRQYDVQALLDRISEALADLEWEAVRQLAEDALALDPANEDAHAFLGAAEQRLGQAPRHADDGEGQPTETAEAPPAPAPPARAAQESPAEAVLLEDGHPQHEVSGPLSEPILRLRVQVTNTAQQRVSLLRTRVELDTEPRVQLRQMRIRRTVQGSERDVPVLDLEPGLMVLVEFEVPLTPLDQGQQIAGRLLFDPDVAGVTVEPYQFNVVAPSE